MNGQIKTILGPPGTGKTSKLIDIMEMEMERGIYPEEIAFVSFTRKAAKEAMDRVKGRFIIANNNFPYVRTLHSLAYQQLGLLQDEIMKKEDFDELGDYLGLEFSVKEGFNAHEGVPIMSPYNADRYLFLDGLARAKKTTPQKVWAEFGDHDLNWFEYERFSKALKEYKHDRGLLDFSDLLAQHHEPAPVKIAIIDEAQDLSTLQWDFVYRIFSNVERLYVAGDDDQAIYAWSGADIDHFTNLPGEKEVLHKSYRVPRKIYAVAEDIKQRISTRLVKKYLPSDNEGSVEYHYNFDSIDMSEGSWLLLARNGYMLKQIAYSCRVNGYLYSYRGASIIKKEHLTVITLWERWRKGQPITIQERFLIDSYLPPDTTEWPNTIWHEALQKIPLWDRELYISLLRRSEKLSDTPRINISTIHGAKGGEADNVVLLSDMTQKTADASDINPDAEHRVWYVAATRAKESLHVIMPLTKTSYSI